MSEFELEKQLNAFIFSEQKRTTIIYNAAKYFLRKARRGILNDISIPTLELYNIEPKSTIHYMDVIKYMYLQTYYNYIYVENLPEDVNKTLQKSGWKVHSKENNSLIKKLKE